MRMVVEKAGSGLAGVQLVEPDSRSQQGYGWANLLRFGKSNGVVTLRRRQQIDRIEGRNDLAADHDFLEVVATRQRFVIEKAKPKIRLFRVHRNDTSGIQHGISLSNAYATAFGGNPKLQIPNPKADDAP
jgi:hypothetical protein